MKEIDIKYREITNLVIEGLSIKEAMKLTGRSDAWFYRNLSEQQKLELHQTKTLNTLYGAGSRDLRSPRNAVLIRHFEYDRSYNLIEE